MHDAGLFRVLSAPQCLGGAPLSIASSMLVGCPDWTSKGSNNDTTQPRAVSFYYFKNTLSSTGAGATLFQSHAEPTPAVQTDGQGGLPHWVEIVRRVRELQPQVMRQILFSIL